MFGEKGSNLATSDKGGTTMGLYSCLSDSYSDICIDITSSTSWVTLMSKGGGGFRERAQGNNWEE